MQSEAVLDRPAVSVPSPRPRRRLPTGRTLALLSVPAAAAAWLLVSVAFAGGRGQAGGWTGAAYWTGQLLLLSAAAIACLHPRISPGGRVAALFGFTAAQFGIKISYAPAYLRFPDELQHWQTTLTMLDSGRLFGVNYSLPISPVFPGLELLTVAVMRVTGLGFLPAALTVCAVSTLTLTAAVIALVRQITPRWDIVALVTLVYLANPNHGFFTSMYLYTTPALPLVTLALVQVVSLLRDPARPAGRIVLGVAFSGGVLVTHHLSMAVLLGLILPAVLAAVALPRLRRSAAALGLLFTGAAALTAGWVALVAPAAVEYLSRPLFAIIATITSPRAPSAGGVGAVDSKPLVETAASMGAILVLAASTGLLGLWALRRRKWWLAVVLIGVSGLEAVIVVIRVLSPRGEEIAGRAPAYLTLLVAAALAAGLHHAGPALRRGARWFVAAGLAFLLLFVGGITSGWPPYWLRLPGTHHVAGYEAAVDRHTLELGWWSREHLPAGGRFVSDLGNQAVLGTIGGLDPVNSPTDIFYRPAWHPSDRSMVRDLSVRYLVADRRLVAQPPVRGSYFIGDHELEFDPFSPLPVESLDKFDDIEGMGVVFDDGVLTVYDLRNSRYAW